MLLINIKNIKIVSVFLVLIAIFNACANKELDYTYNSYKHNTSNGSSYNYIHPSDEHIIDSIAMHRATLKPYEVGGIKYYPHLVNSGYTYTGIASWYGPNFHARKTSNGERYNMYAYTAAHKEFPMNTILRVTNLQNKKSTIVRVNDRGPFVHGRIIDLSNMAAREIDMIKKGTAKVKIEVLSLSSNLKHLGSTSKSNYKTYKTDKTNNSKIHADKNYKIYVQIGAFSNKDGALDVQNGFVSDKYKTKISKIIVNAKTIYRVWVYNFIDEYEARDFIDNSGINGLYIVRQLK